VEVEKDVGLEMILESLKRRILEDGIAVEMTFTLIPEWRWNFQLTKKLFIAEVPFFRFSSVLTACAMTLDLDFRFRVGLRKDRH
jgi:hypothetical protein